MSWVPPDQVRYTPNGLDDARAKDERMVAASDDRRARREERRQSGGGALRRALRRLGGALRSEDPQPPSA